MKITRSSIPPIILLLTIASTALMRFHLSLFRYFDPDEFAHLHWAYQIMIGYIPYKDFFIYHIPFYQWFLLPIFLLPQSPEAIIFSRVIMSTMFLICAVIIFHLTYKLTKQWIPASLSVLCIIISPIMIDKGIEVRPDILMIFFFLITIWLLFTKPHSPRFLSLAGLSLGLSMLTFQKMIFALPALGILLLFQPLTNAIKSRTLSTLPWKNWGFFLAGGSITILVFLLYLLVHDALGSGLDAIIRTTKDIYALQIIKFSPFLALTPWQFVYVAYEGPSLPWAVNTFLLFAMSGGTLLFAIDKQWKAFFFFLLFLSGAVMYLILFPTPFVQYFVPIMMIGSIPAALFVGSFINLLPTPYGKIIGILVVCCFSFFSFYEQYQSRVLPENSNAEQMQVIRDVVTHIKPDETVYDMTGSYVYRPPGYVLCCHRYANFIQTIQPTPPPLTDSLLQNKTKFIVLDRGGYAFWLVPEPHLSFIKSNYLQSPYKKIYSVGYRYQCTQGTCTRINYEGGTLSHLASNILPIVIEETYILHTIPENQSITIDDTIMHDNEKRNFTPNNYKIIIPETITEVIIQLDR